MLEYVFLKSLSNVETYQDYSNKAVVEYYFPLLIPVFLKKYVFNYFLKKKSISKSIWGQKFKLKYHLDRNNIESFKLFILCIFHFVMELVPFLLLFFLILVFFQTTPPSQGKFRERQPLPRFHPPPFGIRPLSRIRILFVVHRRRFFFVAKKI